MQRRAVCSRKVANELRKGELESETLSTPAWRGHASAGAQRSRRQSGSRENISRHAFGTAACVCACVRLWVRALGSATLPALVCLRAFLGVPIGKVRVLLYLTRVPSELLVGHMNRCFPVVFLGLSLAAHRPHTLQRKEANPMAHWRAWLVALICGWPPGADEPHPRLQPAALT